MFQVSSTSECPNPDQSLLAVSKNAIKKPKPHSLASLTSVIQGWQPSDPTASRRSLINELQMLLEGKEYSCARSCIPGIIVDRQFPIEMLHYHSEQDTNEFITRMLWMRQEFNSAIGILLGVPDEETAAKVEEAYQSMLSSDEDCIILLM